ncbi:MAG: Rpn family recombination-promoting nuclease/putative transposase [Bacteroidales bacterium]|nr:Rpn family recombination-promoting nuclease/putative transposase [Bacteroidales bacterium]
MNYLDPRADIVFRKIFGEHKHLCMSLLNSLLPLPSDAPIESIEYQDPDILPDNPNSKNSVVDVRCTDAKGRTFIVEMQMYWVDGFLMRALFNASKVFANQSEPGMLYKELQPVYSLCLLNENMSMTKEYKDEYRHVFLIKHELHQDLVMDGMTFVLVELKKFKTANKVHKKLAELWLSFLTMMDGNREGIIPAELESNAEVGEAVSCLKTMSLTKQEKARYDSYWDAVSYQRTLLAESMDEGIAIGEERGEKRGIAIGEDKATKKIASMMKAAGRPIEEISEFTGLTPDQIQEL